MKYSILLPTRNRCHLLPYAIRSALALQHDDMEIVISNNSSSDATDEVIRGFSDDRIRYVQPPEGMAITHHWNWLLGQAKGDWIFFLCDDDALIPSALSWLGRAIDRYPDIQVFRFQSATYYYPDSVNRSDGNRLTVACGGLANGCRVYDGVQAFRECYRKYHAFAPRPQNSFISRRHYDRVIEVTGKAFHTYTPDVSAALLNAALCGEFVTLPLPLRVWGHGKQSYGSGARANPAKTTELLEEYPEFKGAHEHSPFPELNTVGNLYYDAFALVAKQMEPIVGKVEIDPRAYLERMHGEALALRDKGFDSYAGYVAEIERRLSELPKVETTRKPRGTRRSIGQWIRRLFPGQRGAESQRVEFRNGRSPYGDFENIHEAANVVQASLDQRGGAASALRRSA